MGRLMYASLEGRALVDSHTDDCMLRVSTLTASSMPSSVFKRTFKSIF